MPDAPVLLCEGEKSADAAKEIFPDYACVSYFGGTGQVDHADIGPLRDRDVIIWPDSDEEGLAAARKLRRKLPRARVLRVDDMGTGEDGKGKDAADLVTDDPEQWLSKHLDGHEDAAPESEAENPNGDDADEADKRRALCAALSITTWQTRDIPPPDHLLGDLITTTTRTFLAGFTGIGKTMFGLGVAIGMASGSGFLHWRSSRAARVLYIDGEMPGELIKTRSIDAVRRADLPPPSDNLFIYGRDLEDEIARMFPSLGRLEPLNTEAGRNFLLALVDMLGGVDAVIQDNVQALTTGDKKDEVTWTDTLPLVAALSARRIGQLWFDHTGHNTERLYGTSTKSWRFDNVGIMTMLAEEERQARSDVEFTLSFDPPYGKARRRTPDNRADFAPHIIRLTDDRWTSEPVVVLRPQSKTASLADLAALAAAIERGCPNGEPWARRLSSEPRSVSVLLEQHGFKGKDQNKVLTKLETECGMTSAYYKRPGNRAQASGLRIGSKPAAAWSDNE